MPRLLLVLPQFPFDAASGAARSMREICEVLAAGGWSVRALALTVTEAPEPVDAKAFFSGGDCSVTVRRPRTDRYQNDRPVILVHDPKRIDYVLLDSGEERPKPGDSAHEAQFDRLFDEELTDRKPDVVFGYGGSEPQIRRFLRAKRSGCRLVFGVRNDSYHEANWLSEFDGILTPSEHMAERYRKSLGLDVTGIPSVLSRKDVIAEEREPIFFTVINPSIEKGAFFVARLAEELGVRRPDIPMLIVESRGSGQLLVQAGLAGGFDLRRHENLMWAPAVSQPKEIYRGTRVLLVPSVWEEAGPRVVPEALLNGIPCIVSERGNLPTFAREQGLILALPSSLTVETRHPVAPEDVLPWMAAIERFADDADFYTAESEKARLVGAGYDIQVITDKYIKYFSGIVR